MKRLMVLLSVAALNGCALYDAVMMPGFDSSEYLIATEIRTDAEKYKTECDDAKSSYRNAMAMLNKTRLFKNYNQQLPKNADGISASAELNTIALGLRDRYDQGAVSPTFCKLKFQSIENSATIIQHVIGDRPR